MHTRRLFSLVNQRSGSLFSFVPSVVKACDLPRKVKEKESTVRITALKQLVLEGYWELSESSVHFSNVSGRLLTIPHSEWTPISSRKNIHGGCIFFWLIRRYPVPDCRSISGIPQRPQRNRTNPTRPDGGCIFFLHLSKDFLYQIAKSTLEYLASKIPCQRTRKARSRGMSEDFWTSFRFPNNIRRIYYSRLALNWPAS